MKKPKKILLILTLTFLSIIFAELYSRWFFPSSQIVKLTYKGDGIDNNFKLSDDPVLLYEWRNLLQEFSQNINAFRIIILGDSLVNRGQWPLNEYFPGILENLLNKKNKFTYEVLNAGVPGYNTRQEVRYLQARLMKFSADMVIVGYTLNDRVYKRKIVKYKDGLYSSDTLESYPYFPGPFPKVAKYLMRHSMFYRLINYLSVKLTEKNGKSIFSGAKVEFFDYSYETEEAIKKIKDLSMKEKFYLLFLIFPALEDREQFECDWIIRKCKEYSIEFLDLRDVFKKAGYEKLRVSSDDNCHINKLGNLVTAEEILRYFNSKIPQLENPH